MYGVNRHNNTLVILTDSPKRQYGCFAKAGPQVLRHQTEVIRSMMMGTDIIVVDPENEYIPMAIHGGSVFKNLARFRKPH